MILFKDDWDYYPDAIPDFDTKNKSFVDACYLLKKMGVKNHLWPIQLLDPSLKGINPRDPDLPLDIIKKITAECKNNFFYYLREIALIPGSTEELPIRLNANRGNLAASWLYWNHITYFLIQPRQTGKTLILNFIMTYLTNISNTHLTLGQITKDESLRDDTLSRIKANIEDLPYYLRMKKKTDIFNSTTFKISRLNNVMKVLLAKADRKAALKVGRGATVETLWLDEIAFLLNLSLMYPAALAATVSARKRAQFRGAPYGNIFTTTAGKKNDPDGAYAYDLLSRSAIWNEAFYDAENLEHLENIIRKASPSKELRVNCTFSHTQLGFSNQWLKEALEITNSKGEDADRDYFNKWTSGGVSHPLNTDILELIQASLRKDFKLRISPKYDYSIRWYVDNPESFMKMNSTVCSLDTSDASGGDDIGLVITDISTGAVVGTGNYNRTNLHNFAMWFVEEVLLSFEKTTWIPERKSTAISIIDTALLILANKRINPMTRIYNTLVQELPSSERYRELDREFQINPNKFIEKYKKHFGFITSGKGLYTRDLLYGQILQQAAKYTAETVRDSKLIDQIMDLEEIDGRVDHQAGKHDDMVFAWVLGYWFITNGLNLSYYNIDTRYILTDNRQHRSTMTSITQYDRSKTEEIKQKIEDLTERLNNCDNELLTIKYERMIDGLMKQLPNKDSEFIALEQIINKIKEDKSVSHRKVYNNPYENNSFHGLRQGEYSYNF